MVAGCLAQHGVWTGTCRRADSANAKGHFENVPIKQAIIHAVGPVVHEGRVAEPVRGWPEAVEQIIRRDGYKDGPWLWKGSAMYWRLWEAMQPVYVCVRRKREAIIASGRETGYFRATDHAIDAHVRAMDHLRDELGGVDVDADAVVAGDHTTLEQAFDAAGLEMRPRIVDDWVEPSLWTH